MAFAPQQLQLDYWQKQTQPLFSDLLWNLPEQKRGIVNIIGGNLQNFHTPVRLAEYLAEYFPVKSARLLLPSALRGQLPPLANLDFAASTPAGSFDRSPELNQAFVSGDFTILAGDFSKNSATAVALTEAMLASAAGSASAGPVPLLITRDAVDLLAPSAPQLLARPGLFFVASLLQLQKIFRAVYYPRMLMLSQPLIPIIETLHKFTLSYSGLALLTFAADQVIIASDGQVITTPLAATAYTPISLFAGPLAARIAAVNLYNPRHPLAATAAALLS